MVKSNYAKSCYPDLKFCLNEGLGIIQKRVSQPGKMPLYFWICNFPSLPNPPPPFPMGCMQRSRGCLAITSPAGPVGNRKTTEKEQKKDADIHVLLVASKAVHFPGQETFPICSVAEKKAAEKVPSCSVENRGKKRFCFAKELLHLSQRPVCVIHDLVLDALQILGGTKLWRSHNTFGNSWVLVWGKVKEMGVYFHCKRHRGGSDLIANFGNYGRPWNSSKQTAAL